MADQICVFKRPDGKQCSSKAAAFSNYCEEHRPGRSGKLGVIGGTREKILESQVLYAHRPDRK